MARCRFVEPQLCRLSLSDGDWVDVKRDLSTGEQRQMFADMQRQLVPGQAPVLDVTAIGRARALAYLVSWSLVDRHGAPVPISAAAYDMLDTDTSREIREALEAHEEARERERTEEKKHPAAARSWNPTSPSAA
jgi:hypothetical protein